MVRVARQQKRWSGAGTLPDVDIDRPAGAVPFRRFIKISLASLVARKQSRNRVLARSEDGKVLLSRCKEMPDYHMNRCHTPSSLSHLNLTRRNTPTVTMFTRACHAISTHAHFVFLRWSTGVPAEDEARIRMTRYGRRKYRGSMSGDGVSVMSVAASNPSTVNGVWDRTGVCKKSEQRTELEQETGHRIGQGTRTRTESTAPDDAACDVARREKVPRRRENVDDSAEGVEGVMAVVG